MKKLIIIILIFVSFISLGQDLRTVDWKTDVSNVELIGIDTFKFDASPTDYNDKGAIEREIGNYFIDFVARAFKIIDSDATTITVVDLAGENTAPQSGQVGRVYESVSNGDSIYESIGGVDVSVIDELSRWRDVARNNELFARAINTKQDTMPFSYVDFDTTLTNVERKRARLYYDKDRDNLVFYDANKNVSLDIGKEMWIDVYNNSADTILNGKCIVFQGNGGSHPSVKLAQSNLPMNINSRIGLATQDILPLSYGRMTIAGEVRNYNTTGMTTGQKLFLSSTVAGDLVTAKPAFPNYRVLVATVDSVGVNGAVNVDVIGSPSDIVGNIANGSFNEDFDFKITSDGTTVTGTLTDDAGNGYLTTNFSDGLDTIILPVSITIPQGTATNPQFSYVYLEKSTKQLAVSTSYWSELEHIPVATIVVRTAAQVQVAGAIRNQNVNNHLASSNGMGGLDHIRKRIRILYCVYESGCEITVNADDFTTTSGSAWQMHLQPFDSHSLSLDGAYVPNDFTTPYTVVNSLSEMLEDASGDILKNKEYSIVVWGVQNSTDAPDQLMINLPTSTYNSVTDAINDAEGYTDYSIPRNFRGVGFLLYRLTFSNSNGTWNLEDTEDLRGTIPSNVAGGGTGGAGGIESFLQLLDVPSSYIGSGGSFVTVASSETALEFTPKSSVNLTDFNNDLDLTDYARKDQNNKFTEDQTISNSTPTIILEDGGTTGEWAYSSSSNKMISFLYDGVNYISSFAISEDFVDVPDGELTSTPANPFGGQMRLYSDDNQDAFLLFSDGTEKQITGSSASVVTSWNGRTNVVLPASGDYSASQVTNAASTILSNTFNNYQKITDGGNDALWIANTTSAVSTGSGLIAQYNGSSEAYFGYNPSTDQAYVWASAPELRLGTNNSEKAIVDTDGKWRFNKYGDGDFTGTATKLLGVDVNGYIIEEDLTSGSGGTDALRFEYEFTTTFLTSDGQVYLNSTTLSSATEFRIEFEDNNGVDLGGVLDVIEDGSRIRLSDDSDNYIEFSALSSSTGTDYIGGGMSDRLSSGSFSNSQTIYMQVLPLYSSGSIGFGTVGQIPVTNSTSDDYDYSENLKVSGTDLDVGYRIDGTTADFSSSVTLGSPTSIRLYPSTGAVWATMFLGEEQSSLTYNTSGGSYWVSDNTMPYFTSSNNIEYSFALNRVSSSSLGIGDVLSTNYDRGNTQDITLTGNATLKISLIPDGAGGEVRITQDAGGGNSLTLSFYSGNATGLLTKKTFGDNNTIDTTGSKTTRIKYRKVGSYVDLEYVYEY